MEQEKLQPIDLEVLEALYKGYLLIRRTNQEA